MTDATDPDTNTNPFALALNTHREFVEAAVDGAERAHLAPGAVERAREVEVGQTPSEVVYTENKLELVHYEPTVEADERSDVPILIVYALINKPFILDLQPDRSVVRRLLEAGHDVYLIDWNEPSRLDQSLTLEDYVDRYMDNCVDAVREDSGADTVNLLGYCMGGTMSVMYTALYGRKVNALGLMAAGLCFDGDGGVLELWGDEDYFDPEAVVEAHGNVPAEFLDVGFALMDPVQNYVSKYLRFYDNLDDEDFVENFARMERWLDEGIDVAGRTFVQFLEEIYQENRLYRNEMELGGRHVDVTGIDVPILQILGEYDHLVPPGASKPFNEVVGSDDVTTIEFATGHIGLSVSSSSHADLWPRVADWYHDRSTPDTPDDAVEIDVEDVADGESEGEGEGEDEAETAETENDGTDVETVGGIGPTYAGRLRAAGLDTVAVLADADPETVAEAADVGTGRATNWIDRAATLLDGDRE